MTNSTEMGSTINTDVLASSVPRVGVAVFILHPSDDDNDTGFKFLMGERIGSHGANTWALPGGHLEFGESFEVCAAREALEETGLTVRDVQFLTATNDIMPSEESCKDSREQGRGVTIGKHYVTVFMTATVESNLENGGSGRGMPEAKAMEPHRCLGWEWVGWKELVTWATPQMKDQQKNPDAAPAAAAKRPTELEETGEEIRPLFSPLINLLAQRSGIATVIQSRSRDIGAIR